MLCFEVLCCQILVVPVGPDLGVARVLEKEVVVTPGGGRDVHSVTTHDSLQELSPNPQ